MRLTSQLASELPAPELGARLAADLLARPTGRTGGVLATLFGRVPSPPDGSWRFREELDVTKLDFSVSSLRIVDAHLEKVHASLSDGTDGKSLESLGLAQVFSIVPTIGCYVGEVMRRNGAAGHVWTYYHDWIGGNPDHAALLGDEPSVATILVLGTKDH